LFFVNQRLRVLERKVASPERYSGLPPETRIKVHEAFLEHTDLIDAFADENPFRFDEADLEIVRSWKHLVSGTFYAFRRLRNYTVFLSTTEPAVAYGVLALFDPFEVVIGPYLSRMVETTLLPFKGRIVYDGLLRGYNVYFGGGIRRSLNESYKKAKARDGIITSLVPAAGPHPAGTSTATTKRAVGVAKARGGPSATSPARQARDRIVALTDAFCRERLDDEYAALCRKLAVVLARKRRSPLTRGNPESWASGIVRVVGWVNFLDSPGQPHHMKMSDIDEGFGVSEATGSARSRAIRELLNLSPIDPEWMLRSRIDRNPLAWMIQVNGVIVDARHVPREVQEEAFRKGLIPYIPADDPADDSAGE
jgi:hypothetical protein